MNGCHLEESQNNNIWVVGNGESRTNVDLKKLNGSVIGCNALHRDHICQKIVAVDRRMVREILLNSNYSSIPIYTRKNWINEFKNNSNIFTVPDLPYSGASRWDDPWNWNSGPYAVLLACLNNPITVNLLGFDLYSYSDHVNNVYKNTQNYDKSNHHAIDYSHWLHQLKKLFDHYQHINFIQWQKKDWILPESWKQSKNLTLGVINV